jgi:P2-related tail formation protein
MTTEEIEYVQRVVRRCGYCKIRFEENEQYHPECYRNFKERENIMLQKQKEEAIIAKYGELISDFEINLRENPNRAIGYDGLTYNQRLTKEAADREKAYQKKLADREDRKSRQLPAAIHAVKWLQEKIAQDEREAAEEAAQLEQSKGQ